MNRKRSRPSEPLQDERPHKEDIKAEKEAEARKETRRANKRAKRLADKVTKRARPVKGTAEDDETKHIPKSFVIKRGKVEPALVHLRDDIRRLMSPWTAVNLRESRQNHLRDFTDAAAAVNVSHIFIIAQFLDKVSLKVARLPNGPTLTFAVESFSLAKHVRASQRRPRSSPEDYKVAPLAVLAGFNKVATGTNSEEYRKALRLCAVTLQNVFPSIDVKTANVADLKRVVLFNHNADEQLIEVRQFAALRRRADTSRTVERLTRSSNVVDMSGAGDVSSAVLGRDATDVSDSDAEGAIPEATFGSAGDSAEDDGSSTKYVMKLIELGPRMSLKLNTIQQGVADGNVIFSREGWTKAQGNEDEKVVTTGSRGEEASDGDCEDTPNAEEAV